MKTSIEEGDRQKIILALSMFGYGVRLVFDTPNEIRFINVNGEVRALTCDSSGYNYGGDQPASDWVEALNKSGVRIGTEEEFFRHYNARRRDTAI